MNRNLRKRKRRVPPSPISCVIRNKDGVLLTYNDESKTLIGENGAMPTIFPSKKRALIAIYHTVHRRPGELWDYDFTIERH